MFYRISTPQLRYDNSDFDMEGEIAQTDICQLTWETTHRINQDSFLRISMRNDLTEKVAVRRRDICVVVLDGIRDFKSKLLVECDGVIVVCLDMQVNLWDVLLCGQAQNMRQQLGACNHKVQELQGEAQVPKDEPKQSMVMKTKHNNWQKEKKKEKKINRMQRQIIKPLFFVNMLPQYHVFVTTLW